MKLRKRLVLYVVVAVVVVVAILIQKRIQSKQDGRLVLFAPADRGVEVSVDGTRHALAAGGFLRISLSHGSHRVEVVGGITREVSIASGFDLIAVPTLPVQCFAEIDVTVSHYGKSGVAPTVTRRFQRDRTFSLPSIYALSEAELPKERTSKTRGGEIVDMQQVLMFVTTPCDPEATYDRTTL